MYRFAFSLILFREDRFLRLSSGTVFSPTGKTLTFVCMAL